MLEQTDITSLLEELNELKQRVQQQEQAIEALRARKSRFDDGVFAQVREEFMARIRPLVDDINLRTALENGLSAILRARYGVKRVRWLKESDQDEIREIADTIARIIERKRTDQ
ncbi:hypothetical protein TC41_2513 [Alicyclobacillus acidocaldarius subsp. acidocaldarius Tc-4-1]|uniref:Uncharacterized protein n=1 Tax=Alicyclobacillus acidocaldarius (strain Tc-4-1) TaxID=1048834 RepID=F8IHD8_ALIAT|nr:hypothetical protein TC41_2513 [Alicyclobacillus acidocaldarius subsp. acidocaldarius Tc-4-1]